MIPSLEDQEKYGIRKTILLSACFFLAMFSFSIIKPLKQTVFIALVGVDYQPYTRFLTILLLAPLMIIYSKLVDNLRRYQVIMCTIITYGIIGIIFSLFLYHPAYGLSNTETSKWRILGWALHAYGDFFQIFIVSSFWAFSNSICDSKFAKKNYGTLVAASKLAGITSPILAVFALNKYMQAVNTTIPILLGLASLVLLTCAIMVYLIIKTIPGYYLHGYEAVYKLEKAKPQEKESTGVLEGIKLMVTQPYVFGIFGLVYGYEIISAITDYQMQVLMKIHYHSDTIAIAKFLLLYTSAFQGLGFLFAIFGTRHLLKKLDIAKCLIIGPVITSILMLGLIANPGLMFVTVIMVILRAINYGFNVPVREILYIPTVKDIKFKSKAWTDSFGRTFSKATGSGFNILSVGATASSRVIVGSVFSLLIAIIWTVAAIFVGRKYTETIKNKAVIGLKDS